MMLSSSSSSSSALSSCGIMYSCRTLFTLLALILVVARNVEGVAGGDAVSSAFVVVGRTDGCRSRKVASSCATCAGTTASSLSACGDLRQFPLVKRSIRSKASPPLSLQSSPSSSSAPERWPSKMAKNTGARVWKLWFNMSGLRRRLATSRLRLNLQRAIASVLLTLVITFSCFSTAATTTTTTRTARADFAPSVEFVNSPSTYSRWSSVAHAAAAAKGTGGRMGGSFGPSSSSRPSSPSSPPSSLHRSPTPSSPRPHNSGSGGGGGRTVLFPQPRIRLSSEPSTTYHHHHHHFHPTTLDHASNSDSAVAYRFSPRDLLIISGVTVLTFFGYLTFLFGVFLFKVFLEKFYEIISNKSGRGRSRLNDGSFDDVRDDDGEINTSALGTGATLSSITVSLDVVDRDDPRCILKQLQRLSEQTNMNQRQSVQNLVSEVALELLRKEQTIVSAQTKSKHYNTIDAVQRQYQIQSVRNRSKFDMEAINNYGNPSRPVETNEAALSTIPAATSDGDAKATKAVVTISLAIEGDSTELPSVRFRKDVVESLTKLSADAQVDECLLSAEILWLPADRSETISKQDVYTDYPDLIPL